MRSALVTNSQGVLMAVLHGPHFEQLKFTGIKFRYHLHIEICILLLMNFSPFISAFIILWDILLTFKEFSVEVGFIIQVFHFFLKKINYFYCSGSSLLYSGFLQLWQAGATLHCGAWASYFRGFSCRGARALGTQASVIAAHGLSSGPRAQLLSGMWNLLRPGIEPMAPALAGGFLFTLPPGKSLNISSQGGKGCMRSYLP